MAKKPAKKDTPAKRGRKRTKKTEEEIEEEEELKTKKKMQNAYSKRHRSLMRKALQLYKKTGANVIVVVSSTSKPTKFESYFSPTLIEVFHDDAFWKRIRKGFTKEQAKQLELQALAQSIRENAEEAAN